MFEDVDTYVIVIIAIVMLLVTTMAGACIPLMRRFSESQLHLMTSLSAGMLLGMLFLVIMPEVVEKSHETSATGMMLWVMGGFAAVLFIDVLLRHTHASDCDCACRTHDHALTSTTAFIGLAIHSVPCGLALAAAIVVGCDVAFMMLAVIALHKVAEAFSLSSVFSLTTSDRRTTLRYMFIFSLIMPVVLIVAVPFLSMMGSVMTGIPLAIAAGSFMYVGIFSMLPEAFHEKGNILRSFLMVIVGMIVIGAISLLLGGGVSHGH